MDAFVFASSNYNGEVSVWDIRSSRPISTSEAHEGKVLCCDWLHRSSSGSKENNATVNVISGGSDCAIKRSEYS